MRIIADLHVHSRYSRGCSSSTTIRSMEEAAKEKGLALVGTGDFTHPEWLAEIKASTEEENGLLKVKDSNTGIRFMLSTEVATVYRDGNDSKRIHHCILLPKIESVEALNNVLSGYGALNSDGRPMLSMSSAELVEAVFNAEKNAVVFPAHLWTPFFGALGALSKYNSIKEVYGDQENHIFAYESGLSSNPMMNWRLSALDKYTLLSNSDMHSVSRMGREANMFELDEKDFAYDGIVRAIKDKDVERFKKTIEFYPEEGKYHFDGHRDCNFSINPEKSNITICPVCKKPLVIGVLHRVNALADRPPGYVPKNAMPYVNMIPLDEVIACATRKGVYSQSVKKIYYDLVYGFGTEFNVMSEAGINEIAAKSSQEVANAIDNIRHNRVKITPGYDGVYGKIDLYGEAPIEKKANQRGLADF